MAWPQPTDYHDAVQNPAACFKDNELRSGTPLLDPLGLPRAILGNFASVYQILNGSKKYAVRCFLTYHQDQERRYQAISAELTRLRLPFMVGFLFEREGILVKGRWYPILRMDWVEATPLTEHIEANLDSPTKLIGLASQLLKCVRDLHVNGIAHGDLQHGNILVMQDGSIKLIDYDGVYVPTLHGMGSHELGHANYQHPGRDEFKAFGPGMDNFSAWVITASLLAICFDPYLWFQSHCGDERLLFSKADFHNPSVSATFAAIEASPYPKVVEVGRQIRRLLSLPADQVPPVAADLLSGINVPAAATINLQKSKGITVDTTPGGRHAGGADAPGVDWILDHLQPSVPARFSGSMLVVRSLVLVCLTTMLFSFWAPSGDRLNERTARAVGGGALLAMTVVLAVDFHRREERRARSERARVLPKLKAQLRNLELSLRSLNERKRDVQDQEKKELQDLARRVGEVSAKENDAVKRFIEEAQRLISRQQQERADTLRKEQEALTAALNRIKDAHVDQLLAGVLLQRAAISGIFDALKQRLALAGARTAADLQDWRIASVSSGYRGHTKVVAQLNIRGSWRRVDGIGSVKAAALMAWQNTHAAIARQSAPKQLTQNQHDQIVRQYQTQRISLDQQIALAQQQQQQRVAAVHESANHERQSIERQVNAVKAKYGTQYATMNKEIQQRSRDAANVKWRLGQAERALAEYRLITPSRYALAILGKR